MADLTFSVAEILGRPGSYRELSIDAPLEGVKVALARLEPAAIRARLRAESVVEGVLITGRVAGETVLTCARCLREFPAPVKLEVCELFATPGHEGGDEDVYEVSGTDMHLEPMLRDVVALALPLNPHCAEDCAGFCANCGRELENGACDCQVETTDPRWSALDALKERLS